MSAVVTLFKAPFDVAVPKADSHTIDSEGRLVLRRGYSDDLAVFQPDEWRYFVITPERGPDGRFIPKGS